MGIEIFDKYPNEMDMNVGLDKWEIQYNNQ